MVEKTKQEQNKNGVGVSDEIEVTVRINKYQAVDLLQKIADAVRVAVNGEESAIESESGYERRS